MKLNLFKSSNPLKWAASGAIVIFIASVYQLTAVQTERVVIYQISV